MARSKSGFAIAAVLFLLSVILVSGRDVYAAAQDTPTKEEALGDIMDSDPEDALEANTKEPDVSAENHKDFE